MRKFRMQLVDTDGAAIQTSGGKAYVALNGDTQKATLYDADGAALANPVSLTNGIIEFYTGDTIQIVDLYVQAPSGHFVVKKNVYSSGPNNIVVHKAIMSGVMTIPFNIADTTAATETNTGFICPTKGQILPIGVAVDVTELDDTETIDVGTLSTDSGDADGFMDGVAVATATMNKASLANGAITLGTKLFVQDSANAGDEAPEADISQAGKAITYTLSAGSDTAAGFILLPYQLATAAL